MCVSLGSLLPPLGSLPGASPQPGLPGPRLCPPAPWGVRRGGGGGWRRPAAGHPRAASFLSGLRTSTARPPFPGASTVPTPAVTPLLPPGSGGIRVASSSGRRASSLSLPSALSTRFSVLRVLSATGRPGLVCGAGPYGTVSI